MKQPNNERFRESWREETRILDLKVYLLGMLAAAPLDP